MNNADNLLIAAIELSQGRGKFFTDLDFAEKTGMSKDELNSQIEENDQINIFIDKIRNNRINCEICGQKVDVYPDIPKAYCKCGNEIDKDYIPYWQYSINKQEIEKYFLKKLTDKFETTEQENNRLILKIDSKYVVVMVSTDQARMEDYYLLKGWAKNSDYYMIISPKYDFLISSHRDKTNDLLLLDPKEFRDNNVINILNNLIQVIIDKEKEDEILSHFNVEEEKDLQKIQLHWDKILEELPKYALQAGQENSKVQGDRFESHVIGLLGSTIFNAKHVGGPDNVDGIILVYYRGKNKSNILYPVEVKSFRPKDGKKVCRLKDHESQLGKYLDGYTSDRITKLFDVNSILVISYDFDLKNETDKNVMERIKTKYGIDVILMPLRSLIRLVTLYYEKRISSIDPDVIENLLSKRYITEDDVEQAIEELKSRSEMETNPIISSVKKQIKRSP